ncbi:MAG: PQQ-like beta-propeller repeat protein [Bacteroidales bacterium]|nr:PQQ-like beta-propeller repeat protein [Bacteroidales bacterium]
MKSMIRFGGMLTMMLVCVGWGHLSAQDAQWRGPERDGKYPDTGLLKQWPKGGPELILLKEGLGNGYSTPILYERMVYISGKRDSVDVLTKLDLQGNIQWETVYGHAWDQTFRESRSTPTIENDRIYIMGGMGTVVCMDTETGGIIWQVNTHEEFMGEFHRWGMAESLLLTDKAVISSPVGNRTSVVAHDKTDGSLLWEAESTGGQRSYASPLMINHNNRKMILITSSEDLIAVDPEDGEVIWAHDIVTGHASKGRRNNTNTPLFHDGSIFTTSGYDVDGLMYELSADGSEVKENWSDATLDTHHGGIVLVDGYIYGSNWINNGKGNWVCQEWSTGKVMYEEKWHNKGSIIYADGLLYVFEEKQGHVGLVEATPEGFRVISSFEIEGGTGPYWAHMAIYDKMLFIRHGEVLFIYNIELLG